jgi:alpha-tubulin suppressor-like RCC1 family protein
VAGSNSFVSIAAGLGHACGITAAGAASCWGANTSGQLGVNSTTQKLVPTAVSGGLVFSVIDLGTDHSCGVSSGGAVNCWGANGSGQLGLGNLTQKLVPTQVAASGFSQVSSGAFYSCGTKTTGAGNCWGINGFGQLGDSTKGTRTSPTLVKGGLIFVEVVSSQAHSCGRTSAGTVFCWGLNANGRLGQDSVTVLESLVPKQVIGLSSIAQLVAGQAHTCARTTSNQVWCWGLGDAGQLGTGDFNNRQAPTQVILPGGVSGLVSIAAGASHTCGVTSTGALYCWGDNFNGQLGDGSGFDQNLPALVVNP